MRQFLTNKAYGVCLFKVENLVHLVNKKGSKFPYKCKMEAAKWWFLVDSKVSTSVLGDKIYINSEFKKCLDDRI